MQAGPPARPSPLSASGSPVLPGGLTEDDWELLLGRIKAGSCTPFLGAGVSAGTLPLGSDVARKWASAYGYPLDDSHDLARVAQFLAVRMTDAMFPKEGICEELLSVAQPDFTRKDEPHGMLAELPLPVFMTTNYDDFMVTALELARKDPKREICRWNRSPARRTARRRSRGV